MNHLIVYAHPNPKSFCHAIRTTLEESLKSGGHQVVVRDLYAMKFDPILAAEDFVAMQSGSQRPDVKTEQDHVRWADVIHFVHPVWWIHMPAMMKGYLDRVLSLGFAYAFGAKGVEGLLPGKKVVVFSTCGAALADLEKIGDIQAMTKTTDEGTFQFCGMTVLKHHYFGSVPTVDDAARKRMLEEVRNIVSGL